MQFKPTLALCAAFLAAVAEGRIAFTTLPSSVKAGSPVNLAWDGADGTPITITLKRGPSNNLQTVALITGNASGNSYTWTPSTDLENGSDYALQITQDDTDINYTGLFSISGGSASSSRSSSSTAAAGYASSSGIPYNSANATTTAPSGTAPASASGTGSSVPRNTTLSMATLTASSSSASGSSGAATTTASRAASGTSSSTAAPTNAAVNIASNFGLLLAGMAAVVYLG